LQQAKEKDYYFLSDKVYQLSLEKSNSLSKNYHLRYTLLTVIGV